jgi:hypothetical protein
MKKSILSFLLFSSLLCAAQDPDEKDKDENRKSFKEKLFTGGSISLAFYNNTFLVGGSPVLGVSLTNWIDAGIVINYNYTAYRDVQLLDDRLRQTVYGGGVFTKIYPLRFIFAQAQLEHNWVRQKYIPPGSGTNFISNQDVTSFLVGGGYTTGRYGAGGEPFYYVAVLFDVAKSINSPYTDNLGRVIPIIRAGLQIPLFQGGRRDNR